MNSNTESSRQIDAVVFDFGGVLTNSPFNGIKQWGAEQGHDPEEMLRMFIGPSEDSDHPFHRAERGEIPGNVAFDEIRQVAVAKGIDLTGLKGAGSLAARPDVVAYIVGLKTDGIGVALISNNFKEMSGQWRALVAIDDLFDVVVESSAEGVRKPTAEIYERTLARLGVEANRSVFLDDLADNVDGARVIGMHGIFVTDEYLDALQTVDGLLGRH